MVLVLPAMAVIVVLGSAFFCCLSLVIAGTVLSRERLRGIGQAITMPLLFGSNALYQVDALRGLLTGATAAAIVVASALLGRLAR